MMETLNFLPDRTMEYRVKGQMMDNFHKIGQVEKLFFENGI
jgi:hypothetical protein